MFAIVAPVMLRQPAGATAAKDALVSIRWRPLLVPLAVTLFGGAVFYAPIVEIPIKLDDVGVDNAGAIGAISALVAFATSLAAFVFGRVAESGPKRLLPIAFGTAGGGLAIVGFAASPLIVAIGGVVASAGCGLLLPTLLLWVVGNLDFVQRARVTGAWTAATFFGQFLCPLAILALGGLFGGLSGALVALGLVAMVMAFVLPRLDIFTEPTSHESATARVR